MVTQRLHVELGDGAAKRFAPDRNALSLRKIVRRKPEQIRSVHDLAEPFGIYWPLATLASRSPSRLGPAVTEFRL